MMPILSEEQIYQIAVEAFNNDSLLQHYVESRGKWERLAPFLLEAQQEADLRWFVEWLEEDCPHHALIRRVGKQMPRNSCKICWQELKDKLAKMEGNFLRLLDPLRHKSKSEAKISEKGDGQAQT